MLDKYGNRTLVALYFVTLQGIMGTPATASELQDSAQRVTEEIVVTGSQIRGAQISTALPVTVLSAADIETIGILSGDELLENLTEQGNNFFSEAENISGGVNSARGDIGAFNLRNIGTGNTLVLLNGRRMVNAAAYQTELVGGSFIPVNTVNSQSLPVSGLRSLEILKDGASAIYGADAVAGVVNYVLKDDFEGLRLRGRVDDYESLPRGDTRMTVEWGRHFNGGQTRLGVFTSYYERDRINSQDDPRWANSDLRDRLPSDIPASTALRFRNNSVNSRFGQFDIVPSVSSFNLDGVTDSSGEFEIYPAGDSRCAADFQINEELCGAPDGQGTVRRNLNENRDLLSKLKRINLYGYVNHTFDSGLEWFNEYTWYHSDSNTNRHASARLSAVAKHTMGATNYYNPFGPCSSPNRLPDTLIPDVPCAGVPLELDNYRFTQAPRIVDVDGNVFRYVTGLRSSFRDWDWEGALTWSRATRKDVTSNRISNQLLQEGLNDSTPEAINLFADGEAANLDRALIKVRRDNEQEFFMLDFKASNATLLNLATGPIGLLVGLEYRKESFSDDRDPRLDGTIRFTDRNNTTYPFISDVMNSSPTADSDGDRNITSAFVELQIPLGPTIDVQLALRHEDFSDVGTATVGKAAFGWRPVQPLLVRGSWSEAFRAPNLVTVNESLVVRSNTLDDRVCLFAESQNENADLDCTYNVQRNAEGSRDLQPETSENTNLGIVLEPLAGLTFTIDYWTIEKKDTIGLFGEENHVALDLVNLLEAGAANCATARGNPNVIRGEIPDDDAILNAYRNAGICPQGEVIRVTDRYTNLDTRRLRGWDFGAYYELESSIGRFNFQLLGSWLSSFEQRPSGLATELLAAEEAGTLPAGSVGGFGNLVRQNGNIEEKYSARLRWRHRNWGLALSGVRYGDFVQNLSNVATPWPIGDMMTFNLSADYSFKFMQVADSRIRLGVNNLTDNRAPLADRFFGYFADQHTDWGRYIYMDWQAHFRGL